MKIPFSPPYIDNDVINEVVDALQSGWITTGPKVKALEHEIKQFTGTKEVLCVNSWTSGAIMMLKWWGVKEGDEVIVPAYTYCATALAGNPTREGKYCKVAVEYKITVGEIVELIYSFRESRQNLQVPNMGDAFTKKLYATYLSYLPEKDFSYPLKMNVDRRGSFTEFLKSPDRGQVSVNISKPGITKGNHWHHTKNEKFLVVYGKGVIRFRKIDEEKVYEYYVSGDKLEVVDIPVGYTHNIENLGDTDMVTIMWANEAFDPEKPDTYYLEV